MMNKAQWSAVYHYCADCGYESPRELLAELKANGTVEHSTKLTELDEYVGGKTYDDMYQFLGENL